MDTRQSSRSQRLFAVVGEARSYRNALRYAIHTFMHLEQAPANGLVGDETRPFDPLPAWPGGRCKQFENFMRHAPHLEGQRCTCCSG